MIAAELPPLITEQAETAAGVWRLFLVIALAVLTMVVVMTAYVVIRFRRRGDGMPKQTHYRIPIEIAYTAIPLALVVFLCIVAVRSADDVDARSASPDVEVDVLGSQWQWRFTYPESGAVVGGDGSARPELVLPAGRSVRFRLRSADVIHSFWIPGFLFKRDVIPGTVSTFDVDVKNRTGSWRSGVCAEFCGLYHDRMDFSVRVVTPDEFNAWLADHKERP